MLLLAYGEDSELFLNVTSPTHQTILKLTLIYRVKD